MLNDLKQISFLLFFIELMLTYKVVLNSLLFICFHWPSCMTLYELKEFSKFLHHVISNRVLSNSIWSAYNQWLVLDWSWIEGMKVLFGKDIYIIWSAEQNS